MKILEEHCIEKGTNTTHIYAAILSYRNSIAKEIINQNQECNEKMNKNLKVGLLASTKSNNIKGIKFLIEKGANVNVKDHI